MIFNVGPADNVLKARLFHSLFIDMLFNLRESISFFIAGAAADNWIDPTKMMYKTHSTRV